MTILTEVYLELNVGYTEFIYYFYFFGRGKTGCLLSLGLKWEYVFTLAQGVCFVDLGFNL